jgi:hypothetical protein
MKTDKNLFLYLLNHCTLAIVIRLSALNNSIAHPYLLQKNKQVFPGNLPLMQCMILERKQRGTAGLVFV